MGHTADLFSLPTACSSPVEPPAEPALPTPSSTVSPARPAEPCPSVRPCKSEFKTSSSEFLLTQLPPTVPVFISETVQPPVAQVSTLPEEFVPPAALDVDEELAELNGCVFGQPFVHSVQHDQRAVEQGSRGSEFSFPEEPPGGFDLDALADLLDMHNDRLPVCWPHGFDALTAKAVLMRAQSLC